MTGQTSPYRTLKNGSIDLAYYDKRARAIRSEDTFKSCERCMVALRTATDRLMAAYRTVFRGPAKVTKHMGQSTTLHALAYVASSTGSSQSATAPSRPSCMAR